MTKCSCVKLCERSGSFGWCPYIPKGFGIPDEDVVCKMLEDQKKKPEDRTIFRK
jgi:hypothetical protein